MAAGLARFTSGGSQYNARGRQKKVAEVTLSYARSGRASADQGRVWSDIGEKLGRLGVASETSALHDAAQTYGADLDGFGAVLATAHPHQVGAAFALGRELIGVDVFDRAATLAALLPKLVASYALDALEERTADAAPPVGAVAAWLKALAGAQAVSHPAVGLGEDVRLSGPRVSGAALEFGGVALHLSAFVSAADAPTAGTRPGRMARPSQRRRTSRPPTVRPRQGRAVSTPGTSPEALTKTRRATEVAATRARSPPPWTKRRLTIHSQSAKADFVLSLPRLQSPATASVRG